MTSIDSAPTVWPSMPTPPRTVAGRSAPSCPSRSTSVEQPFVVRATYSNAAEWLGKQFVDIAAFDTHLPAQLDYRIYAIGDDAAVRNVASDYPSTTVMDADEFMAQVTGQLDVMLGVIYALLALAVLIALLGIANTLALSIHERTRELGLLRAVGMVRSQVRSTIRWESIMIALFGTTLGLAVGSFFGWAMFGHSAPKASTSSPIRSATSRSSRPSPASPAPPPRSSQPVEQPDSTSSPHSPPTEQDRPASNHPAAGRSPAARSASARRPHPDRSPSG